MLIHATAIAIDGRGVLLSGPSGAGKSDLALRAIAAGAALIADDLVELGLVEHRLCAARPAQRPAMIAVRGIGIVAAAQAVSSAPLALSIRLDPGHVAHLPVPQLGKAGPYEGWHVPEVTLNPFEASVLAKLDLALRRFGH